MKVNKKFLALLLVFMMIMTSFISPISTWVYALEGEDYVLGSPFTDNISTDDADYEIDIKEDDLIITDDLEEISFSDTEYKDDDIVTVVVQLESKPMIKYSGGQDISMFFSSSTGKRIERDILDEHKAVKDKIRSLCSISNDGIMKSGVNDYTDGFDYTVIINGFSINMPYGDIKKAMIIPEIKNIFVATTYGVPETDFPEYDLSMINTSIEVGATEAWDIGYDGSGTIVAILDTGLQTNHEAFMVMPADVKYTKESIESEKVKTGTKTGINTYVNAKVPYAYDYANGDNNVNGNIAHGTHVAGTIAGNNGKGFNGIAPNAQLMIMKIFADGSGTTSDAIILAGLEDSVKLGADSINMSLGSAAGFSDSSEKVMAEAYENCYEAGISLLIAAGNDNNSAVGNRYRNDLTSADKPDNSLVGNPSTSFVAMSVASVQNTKLASNYFVLGGTVTGSAITGSGIQADIPYRDSVNANTNIFQDAVSELCKTEDTYSNEYVVVPGYGYIEDYDGLDVSGKIVLVQRGGTDMAFSLKAAYANEKGAAAIIVYNNVSGTLTPAVTEKSAIPMVGITKADGEALITAFNEGDNIVTFGKGWRDRFAADDGGQPSSFSSWGPAPDLKIKPEIAAPGGNIYSAVLNGGYDTMSGTSMATPHMAGMAALVRQYLEEDRGMEEGSAELRSLTDALLMSTAKPFADEDDNEYSPRKQGAGTANVYNAITTKAYLSVPGIDRPKAEIRDNFEGEYNFTFEVNNLSNEELQYAVSVVSLMEGIKLQNGVKFIDQKSKRLVEGEDYDVTLSASTVTVPANGTKTVDVEIKLSASLKQYIDTNFENGNYVEGYVYLRPIGDEDGVDLTLPYLGFYGDWEQAPIFEGGPDQDYLLVPTQIVSVNPSSSSGYYLGLHVDDSPAYDRLAFSPKLNSGQNLGIILSTLRNVEEISFNIEDETGEELWSFSAPRLRKTYYVPSQYQYATANLLAEGWNGRYFNPATNKYDGEYAPAGKYYDFNISGYAGQLQTPEGYQKATYNFYLDGQAPIIDLDDLRLYTDDQGKLMLSFSVEDDHYVNMIKITDGSDRGTITVDTEEFKTIKETGAKTLVNIDFTGLAQKFAEQGLNPGRIKLRVIDYAWNQTSVYIDIGPQSIVLEDTTVGVGETKQLSITILPERIAKETTITWSSSDENVATVDQEGKITGIKDGKVTITATAQTELKATCIVIVGKGIIEENNFGEAPYLNETFEHEGLTYRVTGPDTITLIADPKRASDGARSYPSISGVVNIPEIIEYENTDFTVTSIGLNAFRLNVGITAVNLPDTIKVIGKNAFYSCKGLETMALPDGIERIDDYALYYCNLLDTNIPANVKSIGISAFSFSGITMAKLPEGLESTGESLFYACYKLEKSNIPLSLKNVDKLIFGECTKLSNVKIANGVNIIPVSAFHGCKALKSIDIPEGVIEIGKGAFYGTGLTSIELPESCKIIGEFAYAGLENCPNIIIPDTVEYVGGRAFWWCFNINTIVFGKGVKHVGVDAITYTLKADLTKPIPMVRSVSAGIALRRSGYVGNILNEDGSLFTNYAGTVFAVDGILYTPISDTEVMVTAYDDSTVYDIVTIPATVTSEGDAMTYTVTAIDDNVFNLKYAINEIHLPDTITRMGLRAFDQLHQLRYINIPKNLTSVDTSLSFLGWDNLVNSTWDIETLEIPASLKNWGISSFSGNRYKYLDVAEGVETIGSYAFFGNTFKSISLPSTIKRIENSAFQSCYDIKEVELPEGLEFIGDSAFTSAPINSIDIPDAVTFIGTGAFKGVITIYDDMGKLISSNPTGPTEVNIGSGLKSTGWNAFRSDANIKVVLNSQRNMLIEFNKLDNIPVVSWDGKTDIPFNDGSVIPSGTEITLDKNVEINGKLIVNGTLIIPEDFYLIVKDGVIDDENGTIHGKERIVTELPTDPEIVEYNVTFKLDDGNIAGDKADIEIKVEEKNAIPSDRIPANPIKEGYKFVGWYETDAGGNLANKAFDFNTEITSDLVLTAKWNKVVIPPVDPDPRPDPNPTPTPDPKPTPDPTPEPTPEQPVVFKDIRNHWAEKDIEFISDLGLVNGTGEETFSPDALMTRGMIVTVLGRFAKINESDYNNSSIFNDVASGQYYTRFIEWAAQFGIVNGTGNGNFSPEAPLTREQLVHMLMNYAKVMNLNLKSSSENNIEFADADNISNWASESVQMAKESGVIVGNPNGTFEPQRTITRAEVITMLARFIRNIAE